MKISTKNLDLSNYIACNMHYNDIVKQKNCIQYVLYRDELISVDQYLISVNKSIVCSNEDCMTCNPVVYLKPCSKCSPLCFLLGLILGILLGTIIGYYFDKPNKTDSVNEPVLHEEKAEVLDTITNDIFYTQHIKTTLQNGKEAEFKIAVVSQEYKWKMGSYSHLENSETIDYILPNIENNNDFKSAKALISVGAASEELEQHSIEKEENRAKERAESILSMLRNHISSLYTLNLGVHQPTGNTITSDQRRVIIISIVDYDVSMDKSEMETSLKLALTKVDGLMFETKNYSRFDFNYHNSSVSDIFSDGAIRIIGI